MKFATAAFFPVCFLAACGEPADVVSADAQQLARGTTAHSVVGGGRVDYDLPGYVGKETYGLTARQLEDGTVDGTIEMHWAPVDLKVHADITCLNVDGDEAWLGMRVTRTDLDEIPVGSEWVFYVADNGSSSDTPDQLGYFSPEEASLCESLSGPGGDLFDWRGELKVR